MPAIRQFLAKVFGVDADAAFLAPEIMAWKYWDRRQDWTEPRSYVLEREGVIVAHAGLWPMTFGGAAGSARGIQMIDWASAKDSPGAGVALVQKLTGMFDFIYSIGGSADTRKVLPAFGFREYKQQWKGVRPLRPLQQMLTHQSRDWKLAPRLVRNLMWTMKGNHNADRRWEAVQVQPEELSTAAFTSLPPEGREADFSPRSPAFFEYLARCPVSKFSTYRILEDGRVQGHFTLSLVRGQARLAGVWLEHPNAETWAGAYSLVKQQALRLPGANELIASGTDSGPSRAAAEDAGLRTVAGPLVYLLDKRKKLSLSPDFQFQFSDDDGAFADGGTAAYWS